MQEIELLKSIRPFWLNRVVTSIARGSNLRDDLRGQLESFFSSLEQSVETGDPAWLDPILSLWASSLTQSDLEQPSSSLTEFITLLSSSILTLSRETLDDSKALDLLIALNPCFSYCYQRAAQFEIETRTNYVSNRLEEVQQTLERLDRSKSDFIAVAAHELKTPLTLIEGYASMLVESHEKAAALPAEMQMLNGIRNGTGRLRNIIDDMIDVSLIDNKLLSLNFQPVWINRLFAVLCNEIETPLQERKQTFEITPFPGYDELTYGDPERLLQVFRNILTNAIKYTPDGGRIQLNGRKLPGFIEIVISDSGIGIAPEDQAFIFEKFTRIGSTSLHSSGKTKFKGGGPGLGLHIAKGITDAHGGTIWVESPGYDEHSYPGTRFHILLPLREVSPDQQMAKLFEPLTQNRHAADLPHSVFPEKGIQ